MIDRLDEAIDEEYAAPHGGAVVLGTLEFVHPAFPDSPRVVNDGEDWDLTLEGDALVDPGEVVTFQACAFEVVLPSQEEGQIGEMKVAIDNVAHILMPYLALATAFPNPIQVTYREYLSTDPTTVVARVTGLEISRATASGTRVEGMARFYDLGNKQFPNLLFSFERFPALANIIV